MAKVLISLPDEELEELDAEAARLGMSRSGYVRRCVEHERRRIDWDEVDATLTRIHALTVATPITTTEALRAERDARADRLAGR